MRSILNLLLGGVLMGFGAKLGARRSAAKKGLVGAKPLDVCMWAFEMLGMQADDELDDLFPGTGAVTIAWNAWRAALTARSA